MKKKLNGEYIPAKIQIGNLTFNGSVLISSYEERKEFKPTYFPTKREMDLRIETNEYIANFIWRGGIADSFQMRSYVPLFEEEEKCNHVWEWAAGTKDYNFSRCIFCDIIRVNNEITEYTSCLKYLNDNNEKEL